MSILSADDVAELRAVEASAAPTLLTITTPGTPIPDGAGGSNPGLDTTIQVQGRIRPRAIQSSVEGVVDDQIRQRGQYVIRLPVGTAVSLTSNVSDGTNTYRVVWLPPTDSLSAVLEIGADD